ncbi:hypothetical protein VNO78_20691 [Psophocarpus tetragonolobus]|uniref:Uncharacterized protein n=1 Tax=Psophocarpus tetragonolobus TaxID=3891 RepID=A0AAN9XHE1_PSOTE
MPHLGARYVSHLGARCVSHPGARHVPLLGVGSVPYPSAFNVNELLVSLPLAVTGGPSGGDHLDIRVAYVG